MSQMLAEIEEQPEALERTLKEGLSRAEPLRRRFAAKPPRLVALVARGTSDNAATFGRYLIEIAAGAPVSLAAPSVSTLYNAPVDLRDALVVGISQSGESTDINLCLEAAKRSGAVTLGVTNEESSAMARIADEALLVRAGREKSVAATKTYTGQLLMMYLLAYALGARLDIDRLRALPEAVAAALGLKPKVAALSERYRFMQQAVVIGRGLNYANAFEFALKMMETSYVVAERFSGADFAHGPIALVERDFPAFLFVAEGPTYEGSLDMLKRLKELQAETLVIAPASRREPGEIAPRTIAMPPAPEGPRGIEDLYTPIPYIIPAQLFAAALAACKGLDPDRPRTLSKVTKTI